MCFSLLKKPERDTCELHIQFHNDEGKTPTGLILYLVFMYSNLILTLMPDCKLFGNTDYPS